MKRKTWYLVLLAMCTIGFWLFENYYTRPAHKNPSSKAVNNSFPIELLPSSSTNAVVKHNHYLLSYNEPFEQAEWVAYSLKKKHLTYDQRKRPFFIEDPKVTSKSADWRNYKRSGYDRGHLCPAGDRRFSEQAYNETFYTSNISPQNREFNAGVWNRLEQQIRRWCKRYGDLYIITGGVLEPNLAEIGSEGVDVPNYFYKIVARWEGKKIKGIAFLIPNKASDQHFKNFLVSIDALENLTQIDFFKSLDTDIQETLEKEINKKGWHLN